MSFHSLLLIVALALTVRNAHAQPGPNVAAAEVLFEEGRTAMAEGKLDLACARFRESDRLDPAVGTRLNLADCEEKRGNLATAWSLFRAASSELPADDDRLPVAKERTASLEVRVPKLTMVPAAGAPSGTSVNLDGAELATGSFGIALPLEPGKHRLIVSAPNRKARVYDVELHEGENKRLLIEPMPEEPQAEEEEGPSPATPPSSTQRTAGYVIGGVGILGLAVGSVTGILTLDKKNTADEHCSDRLQRCDAIGKDANDAGRTLGAISTASFVIGIAGLGAGAYLVLTSPDDKEPSAARTSLQIGSGFVALSRSF